jgi:hypothetical protein
MFVLKEARRSMLTAYRAALAQGASRDVAINTAVARYRAFLPEASTLEARALLAEAISADARNSPSESGDGRGCRARSERREGGALRYASGT